MRPAATRCTGEAFGKGETPLSAIHPPLNSIALDEPPHVAHGPVGHRETDDGLDGEEGTFNICTFWLVESLTRAGRVDRARLDEARLLFEQMLGYANHVGLFAEETGHHGEALGNFPHGFTHLALISSAFNLDRALGR